MINWIFWAVPEKYVMRYLITGYLALFLIPNYVFGLYFTGNLPFVSDIEKPSGNMSPDNIDLPKPSAPPITPPPNMPKPSAPPINK